uniref:Protein phosphatase 1 regulatory subunit 35 C-terminal domain-containing protein n=1 Tax=Anopheles coluzzii TaxID=1518534 RepID=A0A6E8VZF3_ANOCL|nr:protein PPP1R35 homolog [Anopheles coluzzii]
MGKNKHGKRKQYLNNVDVPVSKTTANVLKSSAGENVLPPPPAKSILKPSVPVSSTRPSTKLQAPSATTSAGAGASAATSGAGATKYKQPELHTTLGLSKRIETVQKMEAPSINSIGQLTPSSKKRVNAMVTKHLNHLYDQVVFKKLAPVNVNDTVLVPTTRSRLGDAKARYVFKDKKDPEPVLSDYLRPIPPFTFHFVPHIPTAQLGRVAAGDSWNNFHNIEYVMRIMEEH